MTAQGCERERERRRRLGGWEPRTARRRGRRRQRKTVGMATQSQQKREALRSINDIRVNNEAPASLRGGINAIKSEKRERLFAVAAAAMTNAAASKGSSRHRGSGSFTGSNLTDGDQSKWRNDGGSKLSTAEVVDEPSKQRLATPSAHGDIHGRRAHLKVSTKKTELHSREEGHDHRPRRTQSRARQPQTHPCISTAMSTPGGTFWHQRVGEHGRTGVGRTTKAARVAAMNMRV